MTLDENSLLKFTDVKKLEERITYLQQELKNPLGKTVIEMNEDMAELFSYMPYISQNSSYDSNSFN